MHKKQHREMHNQDKLPTSPKNATTGPKCQTNSPISFDVLHATEKSRKSAKIQRTSFLGKHIWVLGVSCPPKKVVEGQTLAGQGFLSLWAKLGQGSTG